MATPNQLTPNQPGALIKGRTPALELILIVALVIAALASADSFLAKTQQAEIQGEAQRSYVSGLNLLKMGKASEAVDALRKAHTLERGNLNYELDLAKALMAAGKIDEAGPLLNEILEEEPNDGRANLIAARLMSARGKIVDAESYYHRAIYGEWFDNASAHRVSARLELIDFLMAHGKQQELLAELLPLQEEAGKDPQLQEKLGHLFQLGGSPTRAIDVYRGLIRHHRDTAAVYAGLGEAELDLGQYHDAHSAFTAAASRQPDDSSIRRRLDLATRLTGLDPTPRWLSSLEKYRRSIRILQLASADLNQCIANDPSADTDEVKRLAAAGDGAIPEKIPAHVTNEMAESVLGLAQKIWQARLKACGEPNTAEEEPLRLIMAKLAGSGPEKLVVWRCTVEKQVKEI